MRAFCVSTIKHCEDLHMRNACACARACALTDRAAALLEFFCLLALTVWELGGGGHTQRKGEWQCFAKGPGLLPGQ
jgi:hypothetical protein